MKYKTKYGVLWFAITLFFNVLIGVPFTMWGLVNFVDFDWNYECCIEITALKWVLGGQ